MRLGAFVLLWCACSTAAAAQAYQCSPPPGAVTVPQVRQDGPRRAMPIAGYTLALSWSPEFCRGRSAGGRHARQCSGRTGSFGFIVHGLWPEGRGGSWPQWCPTSRAPRPATIRQHMCMIPDAGLLARQWTKHGACMVRRPETYYAVTRVLWNSLRWPDYDRISRQEELTAGDIRRAFADANPHWETQMVGLRLNSRGWLEEMRLCYARNFKPATCPVRQLGPPDATPVSIWRGF